MKLTKILISLISIIILIFIYYIYVNPLIFKNKEVYVPDLIGMEEKEAISTLTNLKLGYRISYISGNNNIVSYTKPEKDSLVKVGYIIDLYILNDSNIYYQSFVGLLYENNLKLIEDFCNMYNIRLEINYEINEEYPEGVIIKQNNDSTIRVKEEDTLILTISVSDSYLSFPNLVGLNVYEAVDILNRYNLSFNIIYYHSLIDNNIVISQSINVGKVIKKGNTSVIDIYVSKGLPLDLTNVNLSDILFDLEQVNASYEIEYINSNEKDKIIKIITYLDGIIKYKIYISK